MVKRRISKKIKKRKIRKSKKSKRSKRSNKVKTEKKQIIVENPISFNTNGVTMGTLLDFIDINSNVLKI